MILIKVSDFVYNVFIMNTVQYSLASNMLNNVHNSTLHIINPWLAADFSSLHNVNLVVLSRINRNTTTITNTTAPTLCETIS